MQISFDQFGNLSPSQKNVFTLSLLKTVFVDEFQESKTRKIIFEGLEAFLTNLSNFIEISFDLWVDGSFVTNNILIQMTLILF